MSYDMIHLFRSAYRAGNLKAIRYLVGNGLDINAIRYNNNEAFLHVCEEGNLDIVKYLVEQGISLDDIRANNILRATCFRDQFEIAGYLIGMGLTKDDIIPVTSDLSMAAQFDGKYDTEMQKYLRNMIERVELNLSLIHI